MGFLRQLGTANPTRTTQPDRICTEHKNSTFNRVNFVRESLILGMSRQATPELRCYGEIAWAVSVKGGAKPWQFQLGAEHAAIAERPARGAPFSAVNIHLREEVDFAAAVTAMTGWQWTGPESGRAMRVGLQYDNGPSSQYEFFQRHDNQLVSGSTLSWTAACSCCWPQEHREFV